MRLLAVVLILIMLPAWGAEYTARVVKITDDDTITILRAGNVQEKVRLASIDALSGASPTARPPQKSV
jgi:endonuclease YncB( thermonuclease family)